MVASVAIALCSSCGSRSELEVPPPPPPEPECDLDEDCPGHDDLCEQARCIDTATFTGTLPELPPGVPLPPRVCLVIEPVECDDNDPCTSESCDASIGLCSYGPSTLDLDGDSHNAPLPGTTAGQPGSCGDDCNDASPVAYPGAEEVCDGVDNDCNGIVDDNAEFIPLDDEPVRISGDIAPAGPGGLAFGGETYVSTYTGTSDGTGFTMFETRLDPFGGKLAPIEQPVSEQNADSAGGPLVWIGDRYGLAWQDRRDADYEVYFALLNETGGKATPDTRLSFAIGFSVNVTLAWTGGQFVVAWQDDRTGLFEIFAQRVDIDGAPIGSNIPLSPVGGFNDEAPVIAAGTSTVGVAFANGEAGLQVVQFQTFEADSLTPASEAIILSDGQSEAVYPTVVWNEDHYLIAWYDRTAPTKAIYAATVSEQGDILVPARAITAPGSFRSRYPNLLPLGDRALCIYADDRDDNEGYELYSRMIDTALEPVTDELRITDATFDSIYPIAAFGPEGDVGVLFRDDREAGAHHVWFTRLGCVTNPTP